MGPRFVALASVVLACLIASHAANATPVTFSFTGTVTSASGIWAGQGSSITGFYTFDSALVDTYAGDAEIDLFDSTNPANTGLAFEFSVTLGAVSLTTAGQASHRVVWIDDSVQDYFEFRSAHTVASDDYALLRLNDFTPSPPDGLFPGSGNLTDIPLLTALDVSLFDATQSGQYVAFSDLGANQGSLDFTVTGIVPEPSTGLLLGLGLVGLGALRRRAP